MPRKEVIGNAELWLGDCRDILPTLSGVDACITDPPYNSGLNYGDGTDDDRADYWDWLADRIALMRAIAPTVIVKHSALKIVPFLARFPESRVLVWFKPFSSGFPHRGFATHWEPLHLLQGKAAAWAKDVFECNAGAGNREASTGHPAQMPEALAAWCIEALTERDNLVCDPFTGSGTTGVSAIKAGRRFVGCEIEPKYFDIACRRIEEATKQGDLIRDILPKPEQKGLEL
jgi:site-specific DNA-methyltransferase (adenine-specific)